MVNEMFVGSLQSGPLRFVCSFLGKLWEILESVIHISGNFGGDVLGAW